MPVLDWEVPLCAVWESKESTILERLLCDTHTHTHTHTHTPPIRTNVRLYGTYGWI